MTSDRRRLGDAIDRAAGGEDGGTLLRDALMSVGERALKQIVGRKAIVVLTDGADHGSEVNPEDLLQRVVQWETLIYPIYYDPVPRPGRWSVGPVPTPGSRVPPPPDDGSIRAELERERHEIFQFFDRLSTASGGRSYRSDLVNLARTFESVAEELRHYYLLGFYPTRDRLDGNVHALRVEVARPDVAVRGRLSYRSAEP